MGQHYLNPEDESHPHRLPNLEVFFESGWYFWFCLPGCLPDSEQEGPFDSETEALADAREQYGDSDA
jgi:hypothetical protein